MKNKIDKIKALNMFLDGKTYKEIGEEFNSTKAGAYYLIDTYVKGKGTGLLVGNPIVIKKILREKERRQLSKVQAKEPFKSKALKQVLLRMKEEQKCITQSKNI